MIMLRMNTRVREAMAGSPWVAVMIIVIGEAGVNFSAGHGMLGIKWSLSVVVNKRRAGVTAGRDLPLYGSLCPKSRIDP